MFERLHNWGTRSHREPSAPRQPVGRRTRIEVVEALELRTLMSGMGPYPRILNGDSLDDASESSGRGVPRIVNGTPTSGFSSVGEVGDRSGGFCSGTLIAPQYVLTAGHCGDGVAATAGRFFVGSETYATSQVFVHPNYNGNRIGVDDTANDIAIYQLNQPVDGVTPSPLFRGTPRVGDVLTLVGFGAGGTGSGHDGSFGTKRVGTTPIDGVSPRRILWTFDNNSESNTAPGDSGGPAFLETGGVFYVAGVTSGGDRANAGIGDHSYDTRVDFYATWIDSVVGNQPPAPSPEPEPEPDDHTNSPGSDATPLTIGLGGDFSGSGVLEVTGDRDVFQLEVLARSNATIDLVSVDDSLDTFLRVFDAVGNVVSQNDDFGGTTDSHVNISLRPGVYFVSAGSFLDGGAGAFTLTGNLTPDDHGDTTSDATEFQISVGGDASQLGQIGHSRDVDFFRFVAKRTGATAIDLKAAASNLDTVLTVYDARGRRIAFNDDFGVGTDSRVQVRLRAGSTYFIQASGYGSSTGKYSLQLAPSLTGRSRGHRNPLPVLTRSTRSPGVDADEGRIAEPALPRDDHGAGLASARMNSWIEAYARSVVEETPSSHSSGIESAAVDEALGCELSSSSV